jgi:hypothetical protein
MVAAPPGGAVVKTRVLESVRRPLGAWLLLCILLLLVGVVGGLAAGAGLLDAAVDLPESLRVLAPYGLAGAGLCVAAFGIWRWRQFDDEGIARSYERTQPALGNRLINAVQLSGRAAATATEECLRQQAVELGREAAAGVVIWPAVRRTAQVAGLLAGAALLVWVALLLGGRDLLSAVAPRFFDPRGDHPPYSRLKISVTPGIAEVLYGGQVEVRATVAPANASSDKFFLVAKSGTNVTRTLMFLAPDRSFFQSLANLREPVEYFVTDGRARSHRFSIAIRYTPQITLAEVTTAFPEYTGKPPHAGKLGEEPMALPEETRLSFRIASNRPLKSGQMVLTPVLGGQPSQVVFTPEQNNVVTGSFVLKEPVVFSITVRDVNGLESAIPRQGRLNILPDERPRLFVLEPGRDAVATPSIRVPVRVEATDDYGITRVLWLRALNHSVERPFNMKLALKSGPQAVEASGEFDFGKLGVRPGDVIEYYFEAADNYPKGPNLAFSRPYKIQIISQEQYESILRQSAARKALFEPYFALDSWLRRLAERARNLENKAQSGSEADRQAAAKEAAALAADLAKYEKELGEVLRQATLFDVEQAFRNTLVAQHTGVGEARKKLDAARGSGQLDPKELSEASDLLNKLSNTEEDEVGQPAKQIAAVAQLLARADTFAKLARQQAALAQLARRFSDKSGGLSRVEQIEMDELADQQRRINGALRSMLDSLPELLAKLPDLPQYEPLRSDVDAFLKAIARETIEDDLAQSAVKLSALDGPAGHALAQQAADKMDKLVAKCCSSLEGQAKNCLRFQPSVQEALRDTLSQILAAMGAKPGNGQNGQNGKDGKDGYALFNDEVALYGPNMQLAGEQAGGGREPAAAANRRSERVSGDARDPALKPAAAPGRVRLQTDAKFPLRYRDLIGDYFKAIAESEAVREGGK